MTLVTLAVMLKMRHIWTSHLTPAQQLKSPSVYLSRNAVHYSVSIGVDVDQNQSVHHVRMIQLLTHTHGHTKVNLFNFCVYNTLSC